jgi:hypothetical protein
LRVDLPFFHTYLGDLDRYDRVYSNFPIFGAYPFNFDDLGEYQFENCLIIIDEIMHYCDSRDWKKFDEKLKYFFSMHRHYNIDIIYCSQSYKDCDLKIRNLTHAFFHLRKVGERTKITPLFAFMNLQNNQICEGYEAAPPVGCSSFRRSRWFWMFDSYARREFPPLDVSAEWQFPPGVSPPPSLFARCRDAVVRAAHTISRRCRSVRRTRTKS